MSKKYTDKQILHRKVRSSYKWKELREEVRKEQKVDPVTLKPLTSSFNLHHLSQNDKYYDDLNKDRFVGLNSTTHDMIHFLYKIYEREGDFDCLERIKEILIKMKEITDKDVNR